MNDERIHFAASHGYSHAVEHYRRGRPSYPDDAVGYLVEALGIHEGRDVLELGAGSGKFTELIALSGARVTATEPVNAMRESLEHNCPTVTILDGTAEAIPVTDASSDAVVAAQSFHWFDGDLALPEIHRVLRKGGTLGLIWNIRDEASDWSERLTAIFDRHSGDGPRYRDGLWREAFERTDLFGTLHHRVAYHLHHVTPEAFMDRVLSVSYVASASEEERDRVRAEVVEMIDTDEELKGRDEIVMPYRTEVFWCSRR